MVESSSAKPFMEFNEWHGRVYNLFLAEYKKRFPKRSLWVLHVPELRGILRKGSFGGAICTTQIK
jgi:hypothetical protein